MARTASEMAGKKTRRGKLQNLGRRGFEKRRRLQCTTPERFLWSASRLDWARLRTRLASRRASIRHSLAHSLTRISISPSISHVSVIPGAKSAFVLTLYSLLFASTFVSLFLFPSQRLRAELFAERNNSMRCKVIISIRLFRLPEREESSKVLASL